MAWSRTHINFYNTRVRVCVKMMTSGVCEIDFRRISGYRYSCSLVHIIMAMQIYHVYLLGYTWVYSQGKTTKLFFCTEDLGFIHK